MNTRTATIRITAAMLIATIIIPNACVLAVEGPPKNSIYGSLYAGAVLWLLSGSPMLVSLLIAVKLKFDNPALILFFSTVAYGIVFVYSQCMFVVHSDNDMRGFFLLTPCVSFYWMIPAWIAAWMLNSHYIKMEKQNTEPETPTDVESP